MTTATKAKPKKKQKSARGRTCPRVTARWRKLLCCLPGYDPFCQADGSWFDPAIAQHYIEFIEECCTHIEGELAGEPFILERWEKAIVANLFGWQKIDSYGRQVRRYRFAFVYVPRKNGKTPLAAAVMNAAFFLDDEAGQQNYCAAGERDQATLSFRHIEGMQANEIEMSSRVRPYVSTRTIVKHDDQSFIKVLSSDAKTKHGGNPHIIVVDELHVQSDRRLVDVFTTSMASLNRKQPILMYLTTADVIGTSICNEKYDHASNVRDNKGDKSKIGYDPEFLPVIYEAMSRNKSGDLVPDDWKKPSTWRKANPNLGVSVSIDYMMRECKRAAETPTYENTFKRLHLNIRTEQSVRWLPMALWDSCNFEVDEEKLKGKQCFVGFDLSTNTDIAGYVMLFPPDDDCKLWQVVNRFFIPKDNAEKREDRDKVPYLTWARAGLISLTEGNVIDYAVIQESFWEDAQKFEMTEIAFDRWNFESLRQKFIADGIAEEKFVSFGQGFVSMSAPSKELEKLLLAKEIAHGGHPVLRWMAGNVAAEDDAAGNIKPSKKCSKEKVDGIIMLVMALGRAIVAPEPAESVYEKRGIRTV